ncbi:MAG: glycoside hydrolase family 2 TIM barrel-domain containing protein [Bacteroidota bacterium]
MRNIYILTLVISFLSCTSQKEIGEEQISLNGDWKFYAIYGEGSNYLNIQETEEDIVIDNNDPNTEKQGNWKSSKKGIRDSKFYQEDYLQHNFTLTNLNNANKTDSSYFRFYPNFKKSGHYEVFTRYPFASHLTAQYNIKHAQGIATKFVSQRVFCNEWNSLGIYDFNSADENYIELTAIASGTVAADAVLFREVPKEQYLKAKVEPSRVFLSEFDDTDWHDLKVPGHWGMLNDFSNYTGKAWYRKTLELPENWTKTSDTRYYLKFGGVYHLAKVYLNGKFIGMNRGGFTPFEFEVTDVLDFSRKNVIAVQADNSAIVGATWNWGGIIREVTLTKSKDIRINHQYIHAEPDLKTGTAELKLKVRIENNSTEKRTIRINSKVMDEIQIGALSGSIELEPNSQQDIHLNAILPSEKVELWHFDHPKLYQLQTTIAEGNTIFDVQENHFGIRKIELTDSQMLLNGEAVRLAGFNRVSEHRFWGSSEPIEVLEKDVDLMKEAGANFMRIMHGTQNEQLIDLCDKKGILLFEEINVRDLDNDEFKANYYPLSKLGDEKRVKLNSEEEEILMLDEPYIKVEERHDVAVLEKNYFLARYWLKRMIERDLNHPSIIGWSVGNELNNHYEYGRAAIEYVKTELDPYRLVTCVSNSGQKKEYTPETDPNTFVDLIMHNMYRWQGNPQEILTTLRTKWPDKPIFISEFGFDPFPSTALDGDKAIFSEWINNFRHQNEFVIGTSMWTFNDYRSGYAGTTAEENRVWGIINSWRQKRRLFQRIKKEHAPITDIEISAINFEKNTANIRMPIRSQSDYPSHSMYDYQLSYQFRNSKGENVFEKAIDLPNLSPVDKEWKGSIAWKPLPSDVLDLTVSLISPTNYSRFDKTISFQPAIRPEIAEIIPAKNAVRILFNKVPNATEYFVSYSSNDGKVYESYKTISNYIDLEGLENNETYSFQLYAINDKGTGKPFKLVKTTTDQNDLPPIIWDAFIADHKLVIGYSSDFNDGNYTIKYGSSKDQLDKEFTSNVRGMASIDLDGESEIYFKIKRVNRALESNWSQLVKAQQSF